MKKEIKSTPFYVKAVEDRTVTGLFSILGNRDNYGDRAMPGMFAKTIAERGSKVLHLWQHDFTSPPIAVVKSLREVGRDELPQEVLDAAPDALGGAEVVREYFDTQRANEVLAAIKAGAPLQMSFAYDAVKFDYQEAGDGRIDRMLREVRLYETSDVLWGANDATIASKGRLPDDFLLEQLELYLHDLKAGARHSTADTSRINMIAQLALDLGASNIKLLDAADDTNNETSKGDDPAAAAKSTALSIAALHLYRLKLAERSLALYGRT